MLFFGKPPSEINAADIRRLVDEAQPESRILEFKEATYPRDKRDDFLADVSAFANTAGGFLVIGVKCDKGVPVDAPGIPVEAVDGAWLQMLNWMRDCLDPRLDGVLRQDVEIGNGKRVLVFGIAKSWNQPHMIKSSGRFYVRTNAGNEPCDCGQIRSLVLQGSDVLRRIREWRAERISSILSGHGPESLDAMDEGKGAAPIVSLHLAPLDSFSGDAAVDFAATRPERLSPMAWNGGNGDRYCFEGMLWDSLETVRPGERRCVGYTLLFRDGRIESASTAVIRAMDVSGVGSRLLYGYRLENCVLTFLGEAMSFCRKIGLAAPLVVTVEILRAKEYAVISSPEEIHHTVRPIGRDVLALPETVVRDLSESPAAFMRPVFDALWNSSGWSGSPNFNVDGTWRRR